MIKDISKKRRINKVKKVMGKKLGRDLSYLTNSELSKLEVLLNFFNPDFLEAEIKSIMRNPNDNLKKYKIFLDKKIRAKSIKLAKSGKKLDKEAFEIFDQSIYDFESWKDYDIFNIKGKNYLLPYYYLASVKGKNIYSKKEMPKSLVRGNGRVKAIPKLYKWHWGPTGGRTCYVPSLDLEIKGIGTISGVPKGNAGDRGDGETPDPLGGVIEGKAIYEFISSLYLYLGGIDVVEPVGVNVLPKKLNGAKLIGPKGDRLGLLYRNPKTIFRVGSSYDHTAVNKAQEELEKVNYLGLIHRYLQVDNMNMAGQILDTEAVRIAGEYGGEVENKKVFKERTDYKARAKSLWKNFHYAKKIKSNDKTLLAKLNPDSDPDCIVIDGISYEKVMLDKNFNELVKEMKILYDEVSNYKTINLIPSRIIRDFADDFKDDILGYTARNLLRDPREDLGRLAYHISKEAKGEAKEKASQLYERYRTDVRKTLEIAKKFKGVDFLQDSLQYAGRKLK